MQIVSKVWPEERTGPVHPFKGRPAAAPLLEEGYIATSAIVDLEVLFSSRGLSDYEDVLEERRSLDRAPITPEVMALAMDLQHALARRGQHRLPIPS